MRPVNSTEKRELSPVPWKTTDVALGIGMVVAGLAILMIIYGVIGADSRSALGLIIIGGVLYGTMLFACWVIGPVKHGVSLGSLGLKLPASGSYLRLLLPSLFVLGANVVVVVLYAGVLSLLGLEDFQPRSQVEGIILEGPAVIGSLALVVLWGPLAEEVFFRGFVFPGLKGWIGGVGAAAVSSLLFALVHFDLRVMIPFFVIGLLLAWLYHRTGSLWSCLVAHAAWNAMVLSLSLGV
jgi:membrane protease YdiL (CAAX protease family)